MERTPFPVAVSRPQLAAPPPRAHWWAAGAAHLDPSQLPPREQRLVLESLFHFAPLAHTASEYEFTLKQMLSILAQLLDLDMASFVDLRLGAVYGVVWGQPPAALATELTREAAWLCESRGGGERRLRNTVLWNRRELQATGTVEGNWYALPTSYEEHVQGCFLFHTPQELQWSQETVAAVCAAADQCLVMPRLILRNEDLTEKMGARYNAVREMISLFRHVDDPEFCRQFLLILLDCARVDRGVIWELDAQGSLQKTHQIGLPEDLVPALTLDGQQPFWQQIASTREMVWIEEPLLLTSLREDLSGINALETQVCHTFLGFPLIGAEGLMGAVALLDTDLPGLGGEQFTEMVADLAASYLDNSHRHRRLLQSRELELQVSVARDIQLALLPSACPVVEGYELLATSVAAKQVGGDFYHVHEQDGRVRVTIGDVSGKGVPAGMLMTMTRSLFQLCCELDFDGERMLSYINDHLCAQTPSDRFVSVFHYTLHAATGMLECWNAGHDPLLVYRAATNTLEAIDADGLLLGVVRKGVYPSTRTVLAPGDCALLYTDGLAEAMNHRREMFGHGRIEKLMRTYAPQSASALLNALLQSQHAFAAGEAQHDDTTLVILRALPREETGSKESYP